MTTEWLTLTQARTMGQFAGVADAALRMALDAANDWVTVRVRPLPALELPPAALAQAAALMTARYLARANSVEGLVSMGDQTAYLPKSDRDAESLIAPYRPMVFG